MNTLKQNKNILLIALAVAAVLLIPLAAMQFTDQVTWSAFDFAIAGALLFGAGLAYERIARKAGGSAYRAAAAVAIATALLLVWINLAVGVIGSEDNPANRMYLAVLAVLAAGAAAVRLRPRGMAGVLLATALAQAVVTAIAVFTQKDLDAFKMVILNGFFIALWAASAWLFQRASGAPNR